MTALYIILGVLAGIVLLALIIRLINRNREDKIDNDKYDIRTPPSEKEWIDFSLEPRPYDDTHANDVIGRMGESMMNELLEKYCSTHPNSYLIKGVRIPNSRGFTSEIDHILFTPGGIFVVETKNCNGVMRGNANDKKWSFTDRNNNVFERRNGVKQNWSHIFALEEHIKVNPKHIHNCVVFIKDGSIGLDDDCKGVTFYFKDFLNHLEIYKRQKIQLDVLNKYYLTIKYFKDNPPNTVEEHIEQMKKLHNDN